MSGLSRNFALIWMIAVVVQVALFTGRAAEVTTDSTKVDRSAALTIEEYNLSNYLFGKFFRRFVDQTRSQNGREPNSTERFQWYSDFVVKQVIVAHAIELGVSEKPEVRNAVAKMERHMLSLQHGPLYQSLWSRQLASDFDFKNMKSQMNTAIDCTVLWFANKKMAEEYLGESFNSLSEASKTDQIAECIEQKGMQSVNGLITWPFNPFPEIADKLISTAPGEWNEYLVQGSGVYYLIVRGKRSTGGARQIDEGHLKPLLEEVYHQILSRRRRTAILATSNLAFNDAVARQVTEILRTHNSVSGNIFSSFSKELNNKTLFSYNRGAQNSITVGDYMTHINDMYVRQLPVNLPDVRRGAENMLVEEVDIQQARLEGIDQQPQFREDHAGFSAFQTLERFESDVLAPETEISSANIEKYYHEHSPEFRVVIKISGQLLTFETMQAASTWVNQQTTTEPMKEAAPANSITEIEVTEDHPIPGFKQMTKVALLSPSGARFGPFNHENSYCVFVKLKDLDSREQRLESVTENIHSILLREALDTKERALAKQLARQHQIEIKARLQDYGINPNDTNLPWLGSSKENDSRVTTNETSGRRFDQ